MLDQDRRNRRLGRGRRRRGLTPPNASPACRIDPWTPLWDRRGVAATLCFVCNQTVNGRQAVPIGAVRLCREMSSPTEFSSSVRG